MKTAVITFPGSNCDRDMRDAVAYVTGKRPLTLWHGEDSLPNGLDCIIIPGGFSYGDYLRCGAIAARSPLMNEVRRFAERGGYVFGVCNGFQILTEAGLLPGALLPNRNMRFVAKNVMLHLPRTDTPFFRHYDRAILSLPVAHHDGCYVASKETLRCLQDSGRIACIYAEENPNGSVADIAGVYSDNFRVLGMMPHPERAVDPLTAGGTDGTGLFASLYNIKE